MGKKIWPCKNHFMNTFRHIASSQEAFRIISPVISPDQEEIWILGLNRELGIISSQCCFRGTVDSCTIHPRELFAPLILMRASQFILAHNHPTGSPEPSSQDIQVTRIIERASRLLMIPLVDHIIMSGPLFVSLNQRGLIKPRCKSQSLI